MSRPGEGARPACHGDPKTQAAWYAQAKGTAHDLPGFYAFVTAAIRTVDARTPILIDGGWYGDPQSFSYWPAALPDARTLYSFHMYAPWEATSAPANLTRVPPYRYPGTKGWFGPTEVTWDKTVLAQDLGAPFEWAKAHGVPPNRLLAGEFGCMRQWVDCGVYLNDVLDILNAHARTGRSTAFAKMSGTAWTTSLPRRSRHSAFTR